MKCSNVRRKVATTPLSLRNMIIGAFIAQRTYSLKGFELFRRKEGIPVRSESVSFHTSKRREGVRDGLPPRKGDDDKSTATRGANVAIRRSFVQRSSASE